MMTAERWLHESLGKFFFHILDEEQSLFSVCILYPVCSLRFVLTSLIYVNRILNVNYHAVFLCMIILII